MSKVKLLSRREIDTVKARDRQREILQGKQLADRVDGLRELQANEEKGLQEWRTRTLKTIGDEISTLTGEKDELVVSIISLNDERRRLEEPLDAEWEKVRAVGRENATDSEALAQKASSLEVALKDADSRATNLRIDEERLQNMKNDSTEALRHADEQRKEAARILKDAQLKRNKIEDDLAALSKITAQRDIEVSARERQVTRNELKNKQELKRLEDFDRKVNDKYRTLLQAQEYVNRLKRPK